MNVQIPLQQNKQRNRLKETIIIIILFDGSSFTITSLTKRAHFTVTNDIYVCSFFEMI